MKKNCIFTMMLLAGMLAACTQGPAENTPAPTPDVSAVLTPMPDVSAEVTPTPALEPSPPPDFALDDEGWRAQMAGYVEDFSKYQYAGETEATFGDRHILLEERPENDAEALVALHYYYDIAGEFDQLAALSNESESLTISAHNVEKQFAEGGYIREYIVKSLSTLDQDQVDELATAVRSVLGEDLVEYDLTEWTLVRVELFMAYSQTALDWGPQLGDGDYIRSFLCGKSTEEAPWKIYELYWED